MSEERWDVEVRSNVGEVYEAMVAAGKVSLSKSQHLLTVVFVLFICFFAPLGATMMTFVIVSVAGGPRFEDLPTGALPITFVLFGALALWLMRQSYVTMAQISLGSRFGRRYAASVDQYGVTLRTGHSEWNTGWGDISKVVGGKSTITVCVSAVALPLPRRAFNDPLDADAALAAMQRWQQAAQ